MNEKTGRTTCVCVVHACPCVCTMHYLDTGRVTQSAQPRIAYPLGDSILFYSEVVPCRSFVHAVVWPVLEKLLE